MIMKTMFPEPGHARDTWLSLNGTWDFSLDTPCYDRKIEVPYPWGSPLSGISEERDGTGYYRRTVTWDPSADRIFLCLGAVDYTCAVRVNGVALGTHCGGYDRFSFDVTDSWNRAGENVIEVDATDLSEKSQTYGKQGYGNARGIWQTPWLEGRCASYIDTFFVKTALDGTVTYDITAQNADGETVTAVFEGNTASAVIENGAATLSFRVENPKLWTPEAPNLYHGTLTLSGGDCVSTYFGIREIGTGVFGKHGHRYVTLNGKPYYINGVLDQSFNPRGFFTLPSDDDCREEILRLKRLGINAARIHIKAEEPLKLYYADVLGLLVIADIPCFWGAPTADARAAFEREMEAQMVRDRNHPSIFQWVVFNETWGLFDTWEDADGKHRAYLPETAEWVVSCWNKAKALDPTRIIEDNSPCNRDHTVTDINTWHFYSNGYERVKGVISDFCENAYVGTQANYREGYQMADVPCMNSECGNVWGIQGSAGDSDISWQYKYMLNEFRRQDKLCGFVFTEFHDVVNEFNGYYKIDNSDKDFGYGVFDMTIRDLHAKEYLGADFAPMTTVHGGDVIDIPLFTSFFDDRYFEKTLHIDWTLTAADVLDGAKEGVCQSGGYDIRVTDYGTADAGVIRAVMPADKTGVARLSFVLSCAGVVLCRNAVLFDIEGLPQDALCIEPALLQANGFTRAFAAQDGNKYNGLGSGAFETEIRVSDIPGIADASSLRIVFEASTRSPMTHDFPEKRVSDEVDISYMLGYRCDPGANPNSFAQTDETCHPGIVRVLADGLPVGECYLPDDPADSRGALSHHYQKVDNLLDEAGSYGYLSDIRIPSAVLLKLKEKASFRLTLETASGAGLSLFGRKCGRYGIGIVLKAE